MYHLTIYKLFLSCSVLRSSSMTNDNKRYKYIISTCINVPVLTIIQMCNLYKHTNYNDLSSVCVFTCSISIYRIIVWWYNIWTSLCKNILIIKLVILAVIKQKKICVNRSSLSPSCFAFLVPKCTTNFSCLSKSYL